MNTITFGFLFKDRAGNTDEQRANMRVTAPLLMDDVVRILAHSFNRRANWEGAAAPHLLGFQFLTAEAAVVDPDCTDAAVVCAHMILIAAPEGRTHDELQNAALLAQFILFGADWKRDGAVPGLVRDIIAPAMVRRNEPFDVEIEPLTPRFGGSA